MGLLKAYKIWEDKKNNSDFKRIKVSSNGSFGMKSKDLFNDEEEVKTYVKTLKNSLTIKNSLITDK